MGRPWLVARKSAQRKWGSPGSLDNPKGRLTCVPLFVNPLLLKHTETGVVDAQALAEGGPGARLAGVRSELRAAVARERGGGAAALSTSSNFPYTPK